MRATPSSFTRAENTITEDNPVILECTYTCRVCPGVHLGWSFEGGELPSGVRTDASSVGRTMDLIFFQGSASQSGMYHCEARSDVDNSVVHNDTVEANILVTASVWIPDRSQTVPRGESAVFKCQSSRKAMFSWNHDSVDGELPPSAHPETVGPTESRLNISNVMAGVNTGKYFCSGIFHTTGELLKADADLSEKREFFFRGSVHGRRFP